MTRPHLALAGVGMLGLVGLVIGAFTRPAATLTAYLGAFAFALSMALGSLLVVLVAHLAGARWLLIYRRLAELITSTFFVLALAFLPILICIQNVYVWARPLDQLSEHVRRSVEHQRPWLNVTFFIIRTVVYFAIWVIASETLFRFSLSQDPSRPRTTTRLRAAAGVFSWPIVLALSFATFDFFMSLDPTWTSSMYPVYFFAGSFIASLALLGVIPQLTARSHELREHLNASHLHALGKLELTFVIFWTYIAFDQFMLVWIADLPDEVPWYLRRMDGVWGTLAVIVIFGQFVFPFLLLLSRSLKRRPLFLFSLGAWLLAIHWLDIVWLVVPSGRPSVWWLHLAGLSFFVGLVGGVASWRAAGRPLTPRSDPFFPETLRYRTR